MALSTETKSSEKIVNEGAEKWLGVRIPVLDHGFVMLVDYMGNDQTIEKAARVSYQAGTRQVSETRTLLRYLMRNRHTSPFEMNEYVFHMKLPIFVARQVVRHRTAGLNEESARYSILADEVYIPDANVLAGQSKSNRQGRDEVFGAEEAEAVRKLLIAEAGMARKNYEYLLNDDGIGNPVDQSRGMLARELARLGLTMGQYTQWIWKMDLHNLLHFLSLRMDAHAQYETRQYANAVATVVADAVPITYQAFVDYELEAIRLTKPDQVVIGSLMASLGVVLTEQQVGDRAKALGMKNKREREELLDKLRRLGLVK